jgi:plant 3beta-hydroxysteroid-4alpha-carboxylate 3-dehydrogenase
MEAAGGRVRWCVVTGGRGFAARHLVTMLLRSCEWRVRVADLPPAIVLDRDEEEGILGTALREGRAAYASADLRDKAQVARGVWSFPFCFRDPQAGLGFRGDAAADLDQFLWV